MKKFLSLFLAVVLVVSLFPVMALADNEPNWDKLGIVMYYGSGETVSDVFEVDTTTPGTLIKLLTDIQHDGYIGALPVPNGKNIILDLNGHVLDRGLISSEGVSTNNDNGSAIEVNGNLTVIDSNPNAEHKFKVLESGLWVLDETNGTKTVKGGVITGGTGYDNYDDHFGGGVVVFDDGSFTMNSGNIVGNTATDGGGGVVVFDDGSFTMNSGNIVGNTAAYGGGGVVVFDGGSFTMNSGNIVGNTAALGGGGVLVFDDGSFTMNSGNIVGNTATFGGGVLVFDDSSFTMNSGNIVGNTAAEYGGGVLVDGNMYVGGTAKITGNSTTHVTDGIAESNIHLYNNGKGLLKISTEKPLTDGAEIGVTVEQNVENDWKPGVEVGSYLGDTMNDSNYKYFFMTNSVSANRGKVYTVVKNGENYVLSSETHKVTVYESENGTVTADKPFAAENDTVTLTVTPTNGYQLKNLAVTDANGATVTVTGNTFIMPTKAVTVTAEFELIQEEEPEPEPERRSYTTVTIGDRDDKEETKAEEAETNPDTGAPVMDLGAVAVVLGAAFVLSKKH